MRLRFFGVDTGPKGIHMGNIRTKDIKKVSFQLVEAYPDKFNRDFENNKDIVNRSNVATTKIIRNKIAGYVTRIKKTR